jgi:hypothetical protein
MVKDKGNTFSVFGRHHNDHVWLELYDSAANEWFPADPSSGLVGVDEWMKGRVWFGKRSTLNPLTEDMIVPFAIFAADNDGKFTINRTQHYLVDEFDRLYGGRLHTQPAWPQWTATLDLLDDKVKGAFAGSVNLHEYEAQIDALAAIYEQLRAAVQTSSGPGMGRRYDSRNHTTGVRTASGSDRIKRHVNTIAPDARNLRSSQRQFDRR